MSAAVATRVPAGWGYGPGAVLARPCVPVKVHAITEMLEDIVAGDDVPSADDIRLRYHVSRATAYRWLADLRACLKQGRAEA